MFDEYLAFKMFVESRHMQLIVAERPVFVKSRKTYDAAAVVGKDLHHCVMSCLLRHEEHETLHFAAARVASSINHVNMARRGCLYMNWM